MIDLSKYICDYLFGLGYTKTTIHFYTLSLPECGHDFDSYVITCSENVSEMVILAVSKYPDVQVEKSVQLPALEFTKDTFQEIGFSVRTFIRIGQDGITINSFGETFESVFLQYM